MIGLKSKIKDRDYRIPEFVALGLILNNERFLLQSTGYIYSSKRIQEGIEYEFVVAEFDEPTEKITIENNFAEKDTDFEAVLFSEENQWRGKKEEFRRLEAILKEEGII